jgi:hypothetical protein
MRMNYPNGTISYKSNSGGGLDDDGNPIAIIDEWTIPQPCHVDTINHNESGRYIGGQFVNSSYNVYIPLVQPFDYKRVKLTQDGKDLGEFVIQDVSVKHINGKIQIVV